MTREEKLEIIADILEVDVDDVKAVSYTHLDVYKRQRISGLYRSGRLR